MANEPECTDQDIRETLEHGARKPKIDHDLGIASILNGKESAQERIADRAIIEALNGNSRLEVMGSGTVRESDKNTMWLAKLGVDTAAESIRLAYMSKHPGTPAGELGKAADMKLAELYTEAAKNTAYEVDRLEYVETRANKFISDMKGGK